MWCENKIHLDDYDHMNEVIIDNKLLDSERPGYTKCVNNEPSEIW